MSYARYYEIHLKLVNVWESWTQQIAVGILYILHQIDIVIRTSGLYLWGVLYRKRVKTGVIATYRYSIVYTSQRF